MLKTIPNGSPLKETTITSSYGYRVHPITKKENFTEELTLEQE